MKNGIIILFCMCFSFVQLFGQEKCGYPDYGLMKEKLNERVISYLKDHQDIRINTVRKKILNTMHEDGQVHEEYKLPRMRKKELTGESIFRLCKKSSLVYCKAVWNEGKEQVETSVLASAIALTSDGVCVTNYHVLAEIILSGAIQCYWKNDLLRFLLDADGNIFPLKEVLACDAAADLAIFKVDVEENSLTPIPFGKSVSEGARVYCLAHPHGNLFYFTEGIVNRNFTERRVEFNNRQVKVMQVSADYAVGSSGGPIIDSRGNLVGMVSRTETLYGDQQARRNFQMILRSTVPVETIRDKFKCISGKK